MILGTIFNQIHLCKLVLQHTNNYWPCREVCHQFYDHAWTTFTFPKTILDQDEKTYQDEAYNTFIECLIQFTPAHQIDLSIKDNLPLQQSIALHRVPLIKLLLEKKDILIDTYKLSVLLEQATANGFVDVIQLLLNTFKDKININFSHGVIFKMAVANNNPKVIQILLSYCKENGILPADKENLVQTLKLAGYVESQIHKWIE